MTGAFVIKNVPVPTEPLYPDYEIRVVSGLGYQTLGHRVVRLNDEHEVYRSYDGGSLGRCTRWIKEREE